MTALESAELAHKLAVLLELPPNADEDQVLEAIGDRQRQLVELTADRRELEIVNMQSALLEVELQAARAGLRQAEEDVFIEAGKARGAIGLGYDEEEWRATFRADCNAAHSRIAKRANGSVTPVGLPRDSSPRGAAQ